MRSRSITSTTISAPPATWADIGQTSQAPVWYRDGRSLAVVARRLSQRRREFPLEQTDLIRVYIEKRQVGGDHQLRGEPSDRDKGFGGSSFSLDREGDTLYFVAEAEGHLSEIVTFHPRTPGDGRAVPSIDNSIRIGALAVSPSGKALAFRAGSPGDFSTPALLDLATNEQFRPLVPDDAARVGVAGDLESETSRPLLRASLPSTDAQNRPIERQSHAHGPR